jgi:hypothetical protein
MNLMSQKSNMRTVYSSSQIGCNIRNKLHADHLFCLLICGSCGFLIWLANTEQGLADKRRNFILKSKATRMKGQYSTYIGCSHLCFPNFLLPSTPAFFFLLRRVISNCNTKANSCIAHLLDLALRVMVKEHRFVSVLTRRVSFEVYNTN